MAKTESTAVNELIELMQNNKQPTSEPATDLFSAPAPQATKVNPPRMTSPVPPMRGAGEVEPLPRGRAPHSTSELAMKPHVRMTTADPERGNTIPPLSRPTPPRQTSSMPTLARNAAVPPAPRKTPRATGAQRVSTQAPAQRPPSQPQQRASSQPPVPPNMRPSQQETLRPGSMPALPAPRASRGSLPTVPVQRASSPSLARTAMQMPIPAPPLDAVAPADIDATPLPPPYQELDLTPPGLLSIQSRPTVPSAAALPLPLPVPQQFPIVSAGNSDAAPDWLAAVPKRKKTERSEGTAVVVRQPQSDTFALVKKLIAPTIILAIIGVMVGGFFAFDGQGGKKKSAGVAAAAADDSARVAMPVVAADEAPAKAAQPEPPTKAEQVENVEAARAAAANESMIPAATSAAIGAPAAPAPAAPAAAAPAAPAAAAPAAPPAPAAPAVAAPAPAPAAAAPAAVITTAAPGNVREVRTLKGMVKLVDVRIDSNPAGAEVMLVDNGKTTFLGTTPLATSVDAARTYDLIFTIPGRPTKMAPLDPAKTTKVDVRIHRGTTSKKEAAPATAKLDSFIDASAAKPEAKAAAPAKPEKSDKSDKSDKKEAGEGTLMVSSKPPCEIIIDGKPTGLTTPQRSITLPAGAHKITFVNATEGINKTVSVTIVADQATKLIQDLMAK